MKFLIVIGLIGVLFLAACTTGNVVKESNIPSGTYDSFAQCVSEKGAVMYGTEWCHYCKNQKELFGDSFDQVNYVDCDKNNEACQTAGVRGYPTWVIDGQSHSGVQQLYKISQLTQCPLVPEEDGASNV